MAPPSRETDPSPAEDRLDTARGALRETFSSLRNLDRLLASPVVGSKSLLDVLPEIRAACTALPENALAVVSAAEGALADPQAASELLEYFRRHAANLNQALNSVGGQIKAKQRLELEEAVRSGLDELDPARSLIELLDEAAWGESTLVELTDVVRETFSQQDRGSHPPDMIPAILAPTYGPVELTVNPRLATRLLPIAVGALPPKDGLPVRVSVGGTDGHACLQLVRELAPGSDLVLTAPRVIPPTTAAARTAADAVGATIIVDDGGNAVVLCFPRTPPTG
jgi:hypothetical protein